MVQREKHPNGAGKRDERSARCTSPELLCRGQEKGPPGWRALWEKDPSWFRHGIERYLNQPKLSRNLKMSTDPRFTRSDQMLDAQLVQLKKLSKENSQHKPTLKDEDMEKLKSSDALSLSSPLSLLRNVWFHSVLYFCRRSREGQRELQKIQLQTGSRCERDKFMAHDEVSKSHPGGLKDANSTEEYARMSPNDGYKAVKLYLSKFNPKNLCIFPVSLPKLGAFRPRVIRQQAVRHQ